MYVARKLVRNEERKEGRKETRIVQESCETGITVNLVEEKAISVLHVERTCLSEELQ